MQEHRPASGGGIGEDPIGPIAVLACDSTVRAAWIRVQNLAEDVGSVLAVDGGAGDGDAEFSGSADGVGDVGSRLVHGSWWVSLVV